MKRLCTICARGGSKGILHKNIRLLNGTPLIAYTIRQALASSLFALVAVSSDSDAVLSVAAAYGAHVLVRRPAHLASDEAPKLSAIRHAVAAVERRRGSRYETIVDLDATAPLRLTGDIREAVRLLEESGAGNVITGTPSRRSPYFNMVEYKPEGGVGLVKQPSPSVHRRQDAPLTYDMNASIYGWRRDALMAGDTLFRDDTRLYVMPPERSWDIDSEADWDYVAYRMARSGTGADAQG
ncbi:acylneuraminate cytidylyltransferase family protein [Paenibacillus sp. 1P07SE]|uniref:acylneuraminate cytidylyltransferase family protein n=1 Tax=Paenibacillus sp. 1P07SE TaxID=3132209 RepID=UPI0039A5BD45